MCGAACFALPLSDQQHCKRMGWCRKQAIESWQSACTYWCDRCDLRELVLLALT